MNDYEMKLEAKRERLERRAALCAKISDLRWKRAHEMASVIPFGQPILVGHYSEGRDRRYRAKIEANYRKAYEMGEKAKYYAAKAANAGTGGISSDDPEAIVKLQEQIDKAEKLHTRMVEANKIIRKFKDDIHNGILALEQRGFIAGEAKRLFEPDFCGRLGFADYQLQNNNANIRRMKQRIDQLRAEHQRRNADESPALDIKIPEGVSIVENASDNRLQIFFPSKPPDAMRSKLKSHGFRWSPNAGAWQRQLNNNARWAAKQVLES
jgi:hypothetical protein